MISGVGVTQARAKDKSALENAVGILNTAMGLGLQAANAYNAFSANAPAAQSAQAPAEMSANPGQSNFAQALNTAPPAPKAPQTDQWGNIFNPETGQWEAP